jgi:hypothetical protein
VVGGWWWVAVAVGGGAGVVAGGGWGKGPGMAGWQGRVVAVAVAVGGARASEWRVGEWAVVFSFCRRGSGGGPWRRGEMMKRVGGFGRFVCG